MKENNSNEGLKRNIYLIFNSFSGHNDDLCVDRPDKNVSGYRFNLHRSTVRKEAIIPKIYNALDLIRNHKLEVPFISFYRKEEVQPELKTHHLWTIYNYDGKYCQLQDRKAKLRSTMKRMHEFLMDQVMRRPLDAPLPQDFKMLTQEEVDRVMEANSSEELMDYWAHYNIHYERFHEPLQVYIKEKEEEKRAASRRTVKRTVKVRRKVMRKKKYRKRAVIDDDEDDEPSSMRKSRSKSKSAYSSKSCSRSHSKSRSKSHSKSRSRSNSRSGSHSRSRSCSKFRSRSRSGSWSKNSHSKSVSRSKSRSASRSKSRSGSRSRSPISRRSASPDKSRTSSRNSMSSPLRGSPASHRSKKSPSPNGTVGSHNNFRSPSRFFRRSASPGGASVTSNSSRRSRGSKSPEKAYKPASPSGTPERSSRPGSKSPGMSRQGSPDQKQTSASSPKSGHGSKPSSPSHESVEPVDHVDDDDKSEGYQSGGNDDDIEMKEATLDSSKKPNESESESEEEVSTEVETEVEEEVFDENPAETDKNGEKLKKAIRRTEYDILRKAGVEPFTKMFGLTPEQFGENLRDNYQRYEVEQSQMETYKEASSYLSKAYPTESTVLEAAVRMVGWQLSREPLVRKTIREVFFERARLNVAPTQKGLKIIDEQHMLFNFKYLKEKPVHDLVNDQYLKMHSGVQDKLITIDISSSVEGHTSICYLDEIKQLYYRDEFSSVVQDWNDLRGRAVEFAYNKIVMELKNQLRARLLAESLNHVKEKCSSKLHDWIKVAPYKNGEFADEDEDDWDTSKGFRVLAISYDNDFEMSAFGALLDPDGVVVEYKRFPFITHRKDAFIDRVSKGKLSDLDNFKELVIRRKPHVVAVAGESRTAQHIMRDLKELLVSMEETEQFPAINIELVDNHFSTVYANSKKGLSDFPDFPPLLRQAISIGRILQDPLLEFSQLCNPDEEILNIRYHALQDLLPPPDLLNVLYNEFINRTNEVGVDLNMAISNPYRQANVQFLAGLGTRKANHLIRMIRQNNQRLETRNHLVISFHMGPKVYVNVAGFVKIETNAFGDSETYIEVLDSTRIHPEAYDWARKMAVDALDCDEEDKPAEALEEILDDPEKLNELDLEAFAKELENQEFGIKNTTLYDIRHELTESYKDYRVPFESPRPEEIFNMLTKETPETLYAGKLIQCKVSHFAYRKPHGDQMDNANPVRNEDTGLWKCPFCMKSDFPEVSDVWNHFDAIECPGQTVGIHVRIDPNIMGFIRVANLSDKPVTNPSERVKVGSLIYARVIKIDPEKFSVDLTSRSSDLQDKTQSLKQNKDSYYDYEAEEKNQQKSRQRFDKKKKTYHKRVIAHQSFRNIDYNDVDKILGAMDQGEAIIRPSSKGINHLTVSWKVTEDVYQHIDIIEEDKQNHFSLGKKLYIKDLEFEDLDEILARYVSPLANDVRQIIEYKYYKEKVAANKEKAAEYLRKEKEKKPTSIPYIFSPVKNLPGRFLLSYLPRVNVVHEYVTVLHDGFKFRSKLNFASLADLLKWFKMNFRNLGTSKGVAPPGRMSSRTPYMSGATPGMDNTPSVHHKSNTTPYSLATPSTNFSATPYSNYAQTPYTPSGQTPFMTPYANTPGPSATPRYGGGMAPNPNLPTQMPPPLNNNFYPYSRPAGARTPARSEMQDWSKAAESWAKASRASGARTPRMDGHMPRGGHTPRAVGYTPRSGGHTYRAGGHTPRAGGHTPGYGQRPGSARLEEQVNYMILFIIFCDFS